MEWIISETMKNTRNIPVFSSEAVTNNHHTPDQDELVPEHSTRLTGLGFIIRGITKQFLSSCLQISLHPH